MIKFTLVITKAINMYKSLGFKVFENSDIMIACSILVIPIMSLEDTIIFASAEEPIVSTWTTCYNYVYSIGSSLGGYSMKGIQIVYSGVYTITNGCVIGLGIIASICLLKDPAGFGNTTKELIVNIFHTLGTMVTGQDNVNLNLPISTVLLGSAAVFGICIGVGNKLYERYISIIVKPIEVLPPVQEIDIPKVEPDVIVTYIQNLNYLIALFLILIILYIVALELRSMKDCNIK